MSLLPAKFSVKCVHSRVGAGGGGRMKSALQISKPGNRGREGGHEINPPSIQARKSGKGRRS